MRSNCAQASMTTDDTIRQHAYELVSEHGVDAPIQAAMRVQELLDQGDHAASALWGRIGKLTNVLLSESAQAAIVDPMNRDSVQLEEPFNRNPMLGDLPPPNIKRWHIQRKAIVVAAVRTGLIDVAEACARYGITIEEYLSWGRLLDEHGMRGLRTTYLKKYRHPVADTGVTDAESADYPPIGSNPVREK